MADINGQYYAVPCYALLYSIIMRYTSVFGLVFLHRFTYITIKCICVALSGRESATFISRNLHLSAGLVTQSQASTSLGLDLCPEFWKDVVGQSPFIFHFSPQSLGEVSPGAVFSVNHT